MGTNENQDPKKGKVDNSPENASANDTSSSVSASNGGTNNSSGSTVGGSPASANSNDNNSSGTDGGGSPASANGDAQNTSEAASSDSLASVNGDANSLSELTSDGKIPSMIKEILDNVKAATVPKANTVCIQDFRNLFYFIIYATAVVICLSIVFKEINSSIENATNYCILILAVMLFIVIVVILPLFLLEKPINKDHTTVNNNSESYYKLMHHAINVLADMENRKYEAIKQMRQRQDITKSEIEELLKDYVSQKEMENETIVTRSAINDLSHKIDGLLKAKCNEQANFAKPMEMKDIIELVKAAHDSVKIASK